MPHVVLYTPLVGEVEYALFSGRMSLFFEKQSQVALQTDSINECHIYNYRQNGTIVSTQVALCITLVTQVTFCAASVIYFIFSCIFVIFPNANFSLWFNSTIVPLF